MACLARAQLLSVALGMLLPAIGLNGWSGRDYDGRGGEEGNCSWDQWSHQVGMSTVDRNGGIASNSLIIRNNGDGRTGLIFAIDDFKLIPTYGNNLVMADVPGDARGRNSGRFIANVADSRKFHRFHLWRVVHTPIFL